MSSLLAERAGPIMTLTINRPEAHNALNADVLIALRHSIVQAHQDNSIRCIILTGSGGRAFCAGADLRELNGLGPDSAYDILRRGQDVIRSIQAAPIPTIAAVNGLALGGGFEMILATTVPILSASATLGLPESGLGLIPGYGGTQRLPRVVGDKVAAYVMLTGQRLEARRAFELGLTPIAPVEPADLMAVATETAAAIASQGPQAVRSILRAMNAGREGTLDAGLELESGLAALAVAGAESTEGIDAFLSHRPAAFDNAVVTG